MSRFALHAPTATIRITTHLWIYWAEVAIDHEHAAHQARSAGILAKQANAPYAEQIGDETKAVLVTVSATAHALDAIYAVWCDLDVVDHVTRAAWSKNKTKREKRITQTLCRGMTFGSQERAHLESEAAWLFGLRDRSVHFQENAAIPQPHPLGTNVAPENAAFSAEAATRAVTFLLWVLDTALRSPKRPIKKWTTDFARAVSDLSRQRHAHTQVPAAE